MRRGKPQIYGTQYVKDLGEDKWKRYKIDSTKVSDEERKKYGVETLAEQKIKEHEMNLRSLSDYYATTNSMDKTLQLIRDEFKKKKDSEYNVSQIGIIIFAYELTASEKNEEALKIHKLNTELYPDQYRPFYYYGECLQKVKRNEEARKAFQKALQLNPDLKEALQRLEELESLGPVPWPKNSIAKDLFAKCYFEY
jgi:tetratricopeptide (TPR) repeat protein